MGAFPCLCPEGQLSQDVKVPGKGQRAGEGEPPGLISVILGWELSVQALESVVWVRALAMSLCHQLTLGQRVSVPLYTSVSASVNQGRDGSCLPREAVRIDGLWRAFGAVPVSLGVLWRDTPHPPQSTLRASGLGQGIPLGPPHTRAPWASSAPPPQHPQGMGWLYPRTPGTPSCREAVRLTWGSKPRVPCSSRSPERGSARSRRRLRDGTLASGDPLNDWPPGGHLYWLSRHN